MILDTRLIMIVINNFIKYLDFIKKFIDTMEPEYMELLELQMLEHNIFGF